MPVSHLLASCGTAPQTQRMLDEQANAKMKIKTKVARFYTIRYNSQKHQNSLTKIYPTITTKKRRSRSQRTQRTLLHTERERKAKGRHSKHAKNRFEVAVSGQRTLPKGAAAARQNASILYFTPLGPGSNWGYRSTHSRRPGDQHHQSHISSILCSLLLEITEIVS